ncbi:hypothetical protein BDV34DRAFT_52385 [Aspergillus parasiticus]|uniref:Uncharacterized protein n=1 Tax=Aspergillus parasiticus TaxID=5067 RepID=A0A5N6D418_ASPPA|nr:hypothetical protein BDV34DRAFT_52385 [Aspergillus parasiticus]
MREQTSLNRQVPCLLVLVVSSSSGLVSALGFTRSQSLRSGVIPYLVLSSSYVPFILCFENCPSLHPTCIIYRISSGILILPCGPRHGLNW